MTQNIHISVSDEFYNRFIKPQKDKNKKFNVSSFIEFFFILGYTRRDYDLLLDGLREKDKIIESFENFKRDEPKPQQV